MKMMMMALYLFVNMKLFHNFFLVKVLRKRKVKKWKEQMKTKIKKKENNNAHFQQLNKTGVLQQMMWYAPTMHYEATG
jgi:hypothetical protein